MSNQPWPTLIPYTETIAHPEVFLSDPELTHATVRLIPLGWPMCWPGQFAVVFNLSKGSASWAVRCFTSPVTDQQSRYAALSQALNVAGHPDCLVDFHYIPQGILVDGDWYPVLKMEWAEGNTLDKTVEQWVASGETGALRQLSMAWLDVVSVLRKHQIAHGDLQHENILVHQGRIKLVDYDGVYVPALKGRQALELGWNHYQHPLRSIVDFNAELDNFSALVIYLSLHALAIDPELWSRYHDDKRLILSAADYEQPGQSRIIQELLQSLDNEVRVLTTALVEACQGPLAAVPSLHSLLAVVGVPHVPSSAERPPTSSIPAWLGENPATQPHTRPVEPRQPTSPLPSWMSVTCGPAQEPAAEPPIVSGKPIPPGKRERSTSKPAWLDNNRSTNKL